MAYCTSCGSPIPDGQGLSCSMCMGVMGYGNDGYYEEWARKQEQQHLEQKQAEEQQLQELMEKEALKKQKMEEDKELLMAFAEEFIFYWTDATTEQIENTIDKFLEEYHAETE